MWKKKEERRTNRKKVYWIGNIFLTDVLKASFCPLQCFRIPVFVTVLRRTKLKSLEEWLKQKLTSWRLMMPFKDHGLDWFIGNFICIQTVRRSSWMESMDTSQWADKHSSNVPLSVSEQDVEQLHTLPGNGFWTHTSDLVGFHSFSWLLQFSLLWD